MTFRRVLLAALVVLVVAAVAFALGWHLGASEPTLRKTSIRLVNRTISVPESGVTEALEARLEGSSDERVRVVVGLARKPSEEDLATIRESGIELDEPLPGDAYFATLEKADLSRVGPLIRWADLRRPEDSIAQALWQLIDDPGVPLDAIPVTIQVRSELSREEARALLGDEARPYGPLFSWRAELTPDEIRELANDDEIVWIEFVYRGATR